MEAILKGQEGWTVRYGEAQGKVGQKPGSEEK